MSSDIPLTVYSVKRESSSTVVGGFSAAAVAAILGTMTPDEKARKERGERIRRAYEEKGLTRADLARLLGARAKIQYHTVSSWEDGVIPDADRLVHLEEITGRTVRWLMTGESVTDDLEETPQIVEDFIASEPRCTPDQAARLRRTRWKTLASSLGIELSAGFVRNAWLEMIGHPTGQVAKPPPRKPGRREMRGHSKA